jgi:hypothetical protein
MLERVMSVIVITAIGAMSGLVLGALGYGLGLLIGRDAGVPFIFIISIASAIVFFIVGIVDEIRYH